MPTNPFRITRRELLVTSLAAGAVTGFDFPMGDAEPASTSLGERRTDWVAMLDRVCQPVFAALADRKLKQRMPVEAYPGEQQHRRKTTYLEALGRALAGIAPWLEHGPDSGPEGAQRRRYCQWALDGIASAVDKRSPDYMDFGEDRQTIVDSAFLSLALLRAPNQLVGKFPAATRTQLADALRATRNQLPPYNNWLLFAAAIEAALHALGESWDRMRVDYAIRQHATWYLGDGIYGDGPHLHQDYYDSFVIHPFLLALMDSVGKLDPAWQSMASDVQGRAVRYAAIQERMIAVDGTYPVVGRSITYRCGAFHLLADMALRQSLPQEVAPEQVRGALTAVIGKTLNASGTFDQNGWLQIGLAGHQPSLGEIYISTGSLYLCTAVFLPLGLPAEHRFWSGTATPWTAVKAWQGTNLKADHAYDERS